MLAAKTEERQIFFLLLDPPPRPVSVVYTLQETLNHLRITYGNQMRSNRMPIVPNIFTTVAKVPIVPC